jgi:hypothetical protein
MGAQASRLIPCLFQDCCFAPEGGAPAYGTWHAWPGESDLYSNPARSAWHLVHGAFLLFPVGTTYHGTPETVFDWQGAQVLPTILTPSARTAHRS